MAKCTRMVVLHHNFFGNISKCNCCNNLQLTIGNVIIPLTEEEYFEFDEFFDEVREDFKTEKKTNSKRKEYVVRTSVDNLILVFSYQELRATLELLTFATLMLTVNKLTEV